MATSLKPPSKSLTARDVQFIVLAVLGSLIISAGLFVANLRLANILGGGGEFYLPWVGGRAFLFDHIEPYSADVPARVQQLVYGYTAQSGNEPYILDIPFHLLLLFFPFSLIPDPQFSRAFFTLIAELALFALTFFSLRLSNWESPLIFAILFFVFCIFNFYSFQALLEATPVLMLGIVYAGILLSLRNEQDELAGALIAVACYHWEVGGPFLILIVLRVLHDRRGRVLAGFGMVAFTLLVISFLTYPGWIIPFLRATVNNLRVNYGFSTQTFFKYIWPNFGNRAALALTILLIIALGYEWNIARGSDFRRFYWAACLTLAASPLLGFRAEMENLAILVLPIALVFAIIHERWRRVGAVLIIFLLIFAFTVPWLIYFFALARFGKTVEEILFIFYPVFTLIGLYWIRWWAIRPPRTWFDRARLE